MKKLNIHVLCISNPSGTLFFHSIMGGFLKGQDFKYTPGFIDIAMIKILFYIFNSEKKNF